METLTSAMTVFRIVSGDGRSFFAEAVDTDAARELVRANFPETVGDLVVTEVAPTAVKKEESAA